MNFIVTYYVVNTERNILRGLKLSEEGLKKKKKIYYYNALINFQKWAAFNTLTSD